MTLSCTLLENKNPQEPKYPEGSYFAPSLPAGGVRLNAYHQEIPVVSQQDRYSPSCGVKFMIETVYDRVFES